MFKNRWLDILMALAFIAAVGFTISTGNAPAVTAPSALEYPDYALRHPGMTIAVDAFASDWFERHPEMNPAKAVDLSDYFQRHPGTTIGLSAVASDWFERHPELMMTANATDLSDYFARHRDSFKLGDTVDLSDWYQRHSELANR
jgi:hypothetical protein